MTSTTVPRRPSGTGSVVDCGYDDRDLIVHACGQEVRIGLGVTLLLGHVQKALQVKLDKAEQLFEIYDVNGARLFTDQDLREAVIGELTPLTAEVVCFTNRTADHSQEDLAQIICHLIREHCTTYDEEIIRLSQEVVSLRSELQQHRQEFGTILQDHRNELHCGIGTIKDIVGPLSNVGKVELKRVLEKGPPLASSERVTLLEHECKLYRLGEQVDEIARGLNKVISVSEVDLDPFETVRGSAYEEKVGAAVAAIVDAGYSATPVTTGASSDYSPRPSLRSPSVGTVTPPNLARLPTPLIGSSSSLRPPDSSGSLRNNCVTPDLSSLDRFRPPTNLDLQTVK